MAARAQQGRPGARFAQFKLVLLGESAVGKSSLVLRFVKDQFDDYRESTIGAAFLTQTIALDDQTTVKFEIWDTAGQERYKSLAPMYYRNANCAVVVYDITQASSLDKAKSWVKELQRQANENIIIALAGNKADLVAEQPDKRAVQTADAEAYARESNLLFFETSAKTAENVKELFTAIAKKLPIEQASQRGMRGAAGRPGGVDLGNRQEAGGAAGGPGGYLKYVHCLVGNAIILAQASGRELHDSAEELDVLCEQVATACRTVGYAVGKVLGGSRTVSEVLRGIQKRCEEAMVDVKRAEGMLKTVFSGDQLRERVVKARVVETRQRLEDGVMWRIEELGEEDDDDDDDVSAVATGTL
ncbi:hypothetical protein B0A55_02623 [Friedmanniomyces simplex]|uniref:GTP-binding protein ypt5 n=1 Tax=Friedmanniomyces simplex TaxID=329884 RepID=A0A4V5NI06_9PEZI|nr:hypothetical protein B0A55_02623 [Friedmanniomyces simplex]